MKRLTVGVLTVLSFLLLLQIYRSYSEGGPPLPQGGLVSLAPHLTEIIFELGAGEQLQAVTELCDYPPSVRQLVQVGSFVSPNVERLLSLHPRLVLAEKWVSNRTVARLRQLGLQVVELPPPQNLEQVYEVIRQTGILLGREEQAHLLVARMKNEVAMVERDSARLPFRPSVYLELDPPSWTIGRASFLDEILALCGGQNLFHEVQRASLQASKEMILRGDPDVIVSFVASREEIAARPGWDRLKAVRQNRIIDDLQAALLTRPGPRLPRGMRELQGRLFSLLGGKGEVK